MSDQEIDDKLTCFLTKVDKEERIAQGKQFIENVVNYTKSKRKARDCKMRIVEASRIATFTYRGK